MMDMRSGILRALHCRDGRLLARALAVLLTLSATLGVLTPAASAAPAAGLHCLAGAIHPGTPADHPARPADGHLSCCLLGCLGAPLAEPAPPRFDPPAMLAFVERPLRAEPHAVGAKPRAGGESPRGPPANA
jgi:hypothetical protein